MSQHRSITLIIADDEDFIRQGLIEIVSATAFETKIVGTAANGTDALSLILSLQPDLAIMDIKMPGIDGLEVIRRADEAKCNTRFLILSGYSDFSYAQKAVKYHAKDYFLKPLNIADFKNALLQQYQEILAAHAKLENDSAALCSLISSSRTFFLNRLLQNEIPQHDITNAKLNELKLNVSPDACMAVVFLPETDSADTFPDYDEIIRQFIHPVFKSFFYEAWTYKNSQIVSLLSISKPLEALAREKAAACLASIYDHTKLRFIAGLGIIVPCLHQCTTSYHTALQALSYRIYEPDLSLYDSSLFCRQSPSEENKHIDTAPLTDAILKHDTKEIKKYCSVFWESLFFVKMPPPNYIRGMCIFLISNVQKDIAIRQKDSGRIAAFTYEDLDSLLSIRHIKDYLTDFFLNYSEQLTHPKSGHDQIIATAKSYIHAHIDQTIKAKDVASKVHLSEAYFAIYFKNHAGVNFRDYVLTAKMDYAKSMISSKAMTISEIAYAVGYQDYRSFSRAFKNVVGVSPSEYQSTLDDRKDST